MPCQAYSDHSFDCAWQHQSFWQGLHHTCVSACAVGMLQGYMVKTCS